MENINPLIKEMSTLKAPGVLCLILINLINLILINFALLYKPIEKLKCSIISVLRSESFNYLYCSFHSRSCRRRVVCGVGPSPQLSLICWLIGKCRHNDMVYR